MIEVAVPGRGTYLLEHIVFDVNGTLALDGSLLPGVKEALTALRQRVNVYMLTADTHGRQAEIDRTLGFKAERIGTPAEKAAFVRQLGVAILGPEGLAVEALLAADILVPDILTALELFLHPRRIVATLRR